VRLDRVKEGGAPADHSYGNLHNVASRHGKVKRANCLSKILLQPNSTPNGFVSSCKILLENRVEEVERAGFTKGIVVNQKRSQFLGGLIVRP
jgi:hypothetical protein